MSEVVYSAQKSDFVKGRIYLNPRFFDGTLQPGATSVIVVGDWPRVEEAYKNAKIPVRKVGKGDKLPAPREGGQRNVSQEVTTEHRDSTVDKTGDDAGEIDPPLNDGDNIEVPEGFEDLPFKELKKLVAKFPDAPDVHSKRDAIEFLKERKPAGAD